MKNRLIVALDTPSLPQAQDWVDRLSDVVGGFKVGLELFISEGTLPKTTLPIVLDLKLHDIPRTVQRAIQAGAKLGVEYMTLHIQQKETLELAQETAERTGVKLLGVTLLTSMNMENCVRLGLLPSDPKERVKTMAQVGLNAGLRGLVTSPEEVGMLRKAYGQDIVLLVPGIRPAESAVGDQKRVGTPRQAIEDGADLLVVGRPITEAEDPVKAAEAISEEMGN